MSTRRVKSAAIGGKPKGSILASTKHIAHVKHEEDRPKPSNELVSWWRENEATFSPILSLITLICLYGVLFYLPNLHDQSIQLVISTFLFALSLLFTSHYFKAKEKRKVENKGPLTWLRNTPPNVRKSQNGDHTLTVWAPSKYTETVFLNFSPVIPLLGYIWVRSFEPFASWLCVGLMGGSSLLLHILNAKLRSQLLNELLLFKEPSSAGKQIFNEEDAPLRANSSTPEPPPINPPAVVHRSPTRMAYEPPRRFDGPASAVFQVPPQIDPMSPQSLHAPIQSRGSYSQDFVDPFSEAQPEYHHGSPMQMDNYFQPASDAAEADSYRPPQVQHTPSRPPIPLHISEEAPTYTPQRKFGLRFGASFDAPTPSQQPLAPQEPQIPSQYAVKTPMSHRYGAQTPVGPYFVSDPVAPFQAAQNEHVAPPAHQIGHMAHYDQEQHMGPQTPQTGARNFGATPSRAFAPPPRFSLQDYD
jgi:hypothetical protein